MAFWQGENVACPNLRCRWRGRRVRHEDDGGFGLCPRCQAPLTKRFLQDDRRRQHAQRELAAQADDS